MRTTIRWRVAIPYVLLILLATAALTLYVTRFVRQEYLDGLQGQLSAEADLMAEIVRPLLQDGGGLEEVNPVAAQWGELLGLRVTVIRSDGVVLGDSYEDPAGMENHLSRPDVQAALGGSQGVFTRFSRTLGYRMMYAAAPIAGDGRLLGVARVAIPLTRVEERIADLRNTVVGVSLLVALLAGLLAVLLAEEVARPVRNLTQMAEKMALGDMSGRLRPARERPRDEIGRLTSAFNTMADELEQRVDALADQRNALTAVLTLMADGVVITDADQRVQLINPAAAEILDVSPAEAVGERFVTVARDYQVVEVWRRCRACGDEQSEMVDMIGQGPFLRVVVTPLSDHGCLVLLQDLTKIRQLETVRRDFISNISHELRTPLASLRALVETMQDGALDDPPAARRFLGLMETEVDALAQMVEELLELARIESGRVPLRMEPVALDGAITHAVERLGQQAKRAKLKLEVQLPADLPLVLADEERIGRVVSNLVHNAIKFTPKKGRVTISARPMGVEVVVAVQDTGVGIPSGELPRIFERFYKADQARSGGGTGLGLAIARHIVEAHGGRIWAESTEGEGSTFFFSLPTARGG